MHALSMWRKELAEVEGIWMTVRHKQKIQGILPLLSLLVFNDILIIF